MDFSLRPRLGTNPANGAIVGYVASAVGSTNGTSTTIIVPAGVQTGDVILMLGMSSGAGNEVTPPGGWAAPVNTGGYSYSSFTHAGAADYTFTVGVSALHTVLLLFYRGFTVGAAGVAFSGLAADPTPNSITVPVNNSLNVTLVGSIGSGVEWAAPVGWTRRLHASTDRSVAGFERDARVASGLLAGATFVRNLGATNGRAIQISLSPV